MNISSFDAYINPLEKEHVIPMIQIMCGKSYKGPNNKFYKPQGYGPRAMLVL